MQSSNRLLSQVCCRICNTAFESDAAYRIHVSRSSQHQLRRSELDKAQVARSGAAPEPSNKRHASDIGGRPAFKRRTIVSGKAHTRQAAPTNAATPLGKDSHRPIASGPVGTAAANGSVPSRSEQCYHSAGLREADQEYSREIPTAGGIRRQPQPSSFGNIGRLTVSRQELQSAQLSSTAINILGPLIALTGQQRDELMRLIKAPGFSADDIPWKSGQEVNTFLDGKQAWGRLMIHEEDLGHSSKTKFYMYIRKNIKSVLQDLIQSPEANKMYLESKPVRVNGERVYRDFGSSEWLEKEQARVRRIDPSAYALGMLFYSDATETKMNKHKFHPLLVMLANFTLDALRSSRGYRRIALLPVLDSKLLENLPKTKSAGLQRILRYKATLQSLAALKELSHSGFEVDCLDSVRRMFMPTAAALVADLKEANDAFLIKSWPSEHPDVNTMVRKSDMGKPGFVAPIRTQAAMVEVIRNSEQAVSSTEARAILNEVSLSMDAMSAYDGFAGVFNYFDLYYNDRLHASSRDVPENILQWLENALGQTRSAALNAYIAALPGFPGLTLPTHGLAQGEKASETQMANLFKMLPVALLAHDIVQAKFMGPIQALLDWMLLHDQEDHSDSTLAELDAACTKAQKACVDNLTDLSPTQFRFPKFYRMPFYGRGIRAFGSVDITSTGFGEQSHALIKGAIRFTNRHDNDAIDAQAINHAARQDTVASIKAHHAATVAAASSRAKSPAQKACEQGVPVMARKRDVMGYITPADTQPLLNLLGGSKQLLKKFQGLLGLQLAGPSASCQTPVGKLPKTCGGTVKVAKKLGVVYQLHRGSIREGITLHATTSRQDTVQVRGDNNKVWFAKLLVTFSYTSSSGSEIEPAFVRWLVAKRPAVKDKKHAKNLILVQLKWEEEKGRSSSADIIELSSILGPRYVQPDPIKLDTFYFNRWVGSTL